MVKKLTSALLLTLSSLLYSQNEYEELSLPSFQGLNTEQLTKFLADWNKETEGKKIHRLIKSHGFFEWGLRVEHSAEWNAIKGSWSIQHTTIDLPDGKYNGLNPSGQKDGFHFSEFTSDYLYFGTSTFKRVAIRGEVSREDYQRLKKGLREQKEIEFMHGGKVSGRFLANMISFIQNEKGHYHVGFAGPFGNHTLVCDIESDEFSYKAAFLDIRPDSP